uniref:Uncharacterized protein n=1 Tax=Aeromonas salmonicida subsp. salmonicida TaxID=29491 RepID=A0A1I9S242_AERSS|nr:putative hypothetical protein [Aeromonas salmonicida subsp. salmonicida]
MTRARQRRQPTLHRERLQHCSSLLPAITPPEARPPDRFAYQVMIPAHRHARGLGHGPAARPPDLISHHLGAWPPDRAAHQVMAPACRPARGLGHGPAAPHR